MKKFAMVSRQGTACFETVLTESEFISDLRQQTERQFCLGRPDDPMAGSWVDVSDNEALYD